MKGHLSIYAKNVMAYKSYTKSIEKLTDSSSLPLQSLLDVQSNKPLSRQVECFKGQLMN
jgi:hypothetical protein